MMSFLSHSAFGAEAGGGAGAADGSGGASTVSECLSIPGKNVLVEVMDPSGVLLGRRLETNTDNQREVLGVVVGHISIRNDGPHPRTVEDVIEGNQEYDLTEAQAHGFMEGCVLLCPSNNVCMFCRNGETVVEAVDAAEHAG